MDLTKFDVREDASTLHLKDPIDRKPLLHDNGEPVTIDLLSIFSRKGRAVQYAMASEALEFSNSDGKLDPERTAEETARRLAELTTGWNHIVVDGEELPFSEETARRVYSRFDWVRQQVDVFVNTRAKHLGNCLTNSSPTLVASSNSPAKKTMSA